MVIWLMNLAGLFIKLDDKHRVCLTFLCKRIVKCFTRNFQSTDSAIFYLLWNSQNMPQRDFLYFQKLKEHLAIKLREKHPEVDPDISVWKGREIQLFQQDLEQRVNGRISEKWFYTHLKSGSKTLPRIDILDLLCKYEGHENWQSFKNKNKPSKTENIQRKWFLLMLPIVLFGVYILIHTFKPREYSVTIVDAYTNKSIDQNKVILTQLYQDQSPLKIEPNENEIYYLHPKRPLISFTVSAPYYYADTIHRKTRGLPDHEVIRLFPNDYALMLHYFSNSDTDDWNHRRAQLSEIISDDARIFQLDNEGKIALEMYTKHSFINKLTIPSNALRNIEILDIRFEGEKISQLRFLQKKGGKNE